MGVDDLIHEAVRFFADVEGLRGIPRAEREEKWQELIQIVEEYIRSAVEYEEECIREREDDHSSGDDASGSTSSERNVT